MICPMENDNSIVIKGVVDVDENYHAFCCDGYAWKVALVFPDDDPGLVSIWGICDNPDCGADDVYKGVSNYLVEDLALWLLDGEKLERPELAQGGR